MTGEPRSTPAQIGAVPPSVVPPRVAVFTLGGTIAMVTEPGSAGAAPVLGASQLLGSVPGLAGLPASPVLHEFRQLPSSALSIEDVLDLSGAIAAELAAGCAGAVVVQGTDTIEETSFLLDLLHDGDQPVVVTGAMRTRDAAGADGPANMLAAIQAAASPELAGLGVLVVFADEIHAARHVRKAHATSVAAFVSPSAGPVGHVIEGRVRLLARPVRPVIPVIGLPGAASAAGGAPVRVGLVTMALGDDGALLRAAAAAGVLDGVVVAGFGAGHVPPGVAEIMYELASRMPVVIASRTGAGTVLEGTYGWVGSEIDLTSRDVISAGFLDPPKARLLLHLLLSRGAARADVVAAFAAAGA
jgi:L-asparaginase